MIESFTGKLQNALYYGVTMQSIVPMRKEPHEQAEMVSQLLFGEYYLAEEVHEKWLRIITRFDHYKGWIDRKFFRGISQEDYLQYDTVITPVLASLMAEIELTDSSKLIIPAGSSLPGYDGSGKIIVASDVELHIRPLIGELILPAGRELTHTALQFLNAPYLWGGRTSFGLDCSGFVQTVFKIHGIALPRDSSQQVNCGMVLQSVDETIPGDLAFFSTDRDYINHVGIILTAGKIIHCSGWVRIDRLDMTGIYNLETETYTHRLQGLRRITETVK